jgi:Sec-independent protein translocase protein TatA
VGFGTEILFILMLGLVVLGPKRLHAMLGHMARAKAELENATHGIRSQLAAELDAVTSTAEPIVFKPAISNRDSHVSHDVSGS